MLKVVSRQQLIYLLTLNSRCYCSSKQNVDHSPVQELNRRIKNGDLCPDEHQVLVTASLDKLYHEIKTYTPISAAGGGLFGFFAKQPKKIDGPKGLYIHGSVGGGKTTLMDLFYDCCPNVGKNTIMKVMLIQEIVVFRLNENEEYILTRS